MRWNRAQNWNGTDVNSWHFLGVNSWVELNSVCYSVYFFPILRGGPHTPHSNRLEMKCNATARISVCKRERDEVQKYSRRLQLKHNSFDAKRFSPARPLFSSVGFCISLFSFEFQRRRSGGSGTFCCISCGKSETCAPEHIIAATWMRQCQTISSCMQCGENNSKFYCNIRIFVCSTIR